MSLENTIGNKEMNLKILKFLKNPNRMTAFFMRKATNIKFRHHLKPQAQVVVEKENTNARVL